MTRQKKFDIHQSITERIAGALETAGEVTRPWIGNHGAMRRPVNIASGNAYNGINILSLWVAGLEAEYPSHLWGTYRQWQERGCQVRKGEKSSLVVFYKTLDIETVNETTGETVEEQRPMARASFVFNAAQVDGFDIAQEDLPGEPLFDPVERAERFVKATGAIVTETGDQAYFSPMTDAITMPERRRFRDTDTRSAGEGFYGVLCHELVHWSGTKSRLDRDMTARFGSESYAAEELVAELGAAFLCADLGVSPEPRADHACYIANWLRLLKNDKKAVFMAAAKASQAATWLLAKDTEAPA